MELLTKEYRVPEIYGDYWFNSEPVPMGAMRGYVILVEFWDYTCQRCLQAVPYLKEWHRRYAGKGLVIIGVHTPMFPFGRDPMNVKTAVEELGIAYPVVMDNDALVWNAFRTLQWPTRCLIDKHGIIRYVHAGEGSYASFEHSIQSLLTDAGYHESFPMVMDPIRDTDRQGAVCFRQTADIVTGWQKGTVGNIEGLSPESVIHYEDPGFHINGRLYLHGNWFNGRSSMRFDGGGDGYLLCPYEAKEVTAVIGPEGEKTFQVFVKQDDSYLQSGNMGDDIQIDDSGRSYITVSRPRMFSLVRNREFGEHTLRMVSGSTGFGLYAVSFLSAVIPEVISNN